MKTVNLFEMRTFTFFLIITSFSIANMGMSIIIHETGHYAVAKMVGVDAEMKFVKGCGGFLGCVTHKPTTKNRKILITMGGMAFNILTTPFLFFFSRKTKNPITKMFLNNALILNLAGLVNLLPIQSADGNLLLRYLKS